MRGLTLSVSQLNEYVRKSLAADPMLRGLCLVGEISNLKRHTSGHWYFTLKDEGAAIGCVMFRQAAAGVRFAPQNGRRVRLYGSVSLYAKTGSYQFYADAMEPDGLGELYLRFEALKERLASEGLFDASLKKPLPLLPRGVGIITSRTGAVVHDIARVAWRRFPGMPLFLCPVQVQGEGAAAGIVKALRLLDAYPQAEVIIMGRGGGSMEDLWAFNEEAVARAVVECRTPVVSAVGHETDFTIADFVADVRAPTPSAAAEIAVPELEALRGSVRQLRDQASRAFEDAANRKRLQLAEAQKRLMEHSPAQREERMLSAVRGAADRVGALAEARLAAKERALEAAVLRLRTTGPAETLSRGYAVVTLGGKAVRSVDMVRAGDMLCLTLSDGAIAASATGIEKGEALWQRKP